MKCAEDRVCRRSSAQTTEADRVPGSRVTMNFYDLTAVHSFLISSTSSNMSVSSSSTPINGININDDVLLSILTMNANMFSDKQALNTTRIASQVCRQWRGLLLDTPSLWAKLIDMNGIRCAPSLEWGIELIRRSGTSPLWINANSDIIWKYLKDEATLRFHSFMWYVDNFISGNWYRVQKLVVVGSYHNFGLTRSMLCSPAPQLEEFNVYLSDMAKEIGMSPIFAGDAPVLRRFSSGHYAVKSTAPWLHHLQFLELNSMYSVRDALAVLSATQNLQELRIDNLVIGDISTPLPIVTLPHLKHLLSFGEPHPCCALLDHLEVPLLCSLTIWSDPSNQNTPIGQIISIVDTFSRYAERCIRSRIFNIVFLDYTPEQCVSAFEIETRHPVKCLLRLSFPLHNDHDSTLLVTFLNKLAQLDLSCFTRFFLRTSGPLKPSFGPFFSHLSSLDSISVNFQALEYITDLQDHTIAINPEEKTTLFPLLKVIFIGALPYSHFTLEHIEIIMKYVLSRIQNGHPIARLNISRRSPLNIPLNSDAFAGAKGLIVQYKRPTMAGIFEYTCGSDDPEKHINGI